MYLFCYARSEKAISIGEKLLSKTEGEWVSDIESFTTTPPDTINRADAALIMIIPAAAAIKLIIEKIYPSSFDMPVITVSPEGLWAGVLRKGGYNAYEILTNICSILDCQALSKEDDRKHYAPNIKKAIKKYSMIPDSEETLEEINELILEGQKIDIYTDLPVDLSEPVLDSLSFGMYHYRNSQLREMCQAYENTCKSGIPAIFITSAALPEVSSKGKCLVLTPKNLFIGIEITQKAYPEYAADSVMETIKKHGINPNSIKALATVASAKDNEAIEIIAKNLNIEVLSYDSKIIKSVKLPYDGGFNTSRNSASDICTAAAVMASDSGKVIVKRSGDRTSAIISIAAKNEEIII